MNGDSRTAAGDDLPFNRTSQIQDRRSIHRLTDVAQHRLTAVPGRDKAFFDELLATARVAARAAAEIHRAHAGSREPVLWDEKGHADWVSEVDHLSEEAAVTEIRGRHPDHAIRAEESDWGGPNPLEAEVTWYIDPLDGTTNYLHGYPYHAASVAAVDADGPAAAAVVNTGRGETFHARRGGGAFLGDEPIHVSRLDTLKLSLLGTGFPFKKPELLEMYLEQFRALLPRVSGIRRTGSAAIDLCDVACGRLDGFWELYLAPWDVAAGVLIVREAGGVVTDLGGADAVLEEGAFLAGNPEIHRLLGRALGSVPA